MLFLFAFFAVTSSGADTRSAECESSRDSTYFLQLYTGLASETDFGPSLFFAIERAEERTYYDGLSIGRRIGTSLLGVKADVIGYLGVQNFRERGFQPDSYGVTLYWKAYREWSPSLLPAYLPLRFGLGQGLSYVSRIPVVEQRDFEPRNSAQTVHYLEWTLQVPVSGLLRAVGLTESHTSKKWWIGYSIFHRSTVFGAFADAPGGVNYPGVTLEVVF